MRLIDADALIEFCAERWIPLNVDAVNMQPTIQPVVPDINVGNKNLIDRQSAIDALVKAIREDPYYDSNEAINGLGVCDVRVILNDLPSAQPELIAQDAYARGFEQGRTQGSVDAKLQPIHCKECRYFDDLCPWSADQNGFCHKAMKKEEFFL